MNYTNFKNQTYNTLPEHIIASNFNNCTFNTGSKFEKCNLRECVVNSACCFDRSNIIVCTGTGLDSSTYEKSNRRDEEEEPIRER